MVLPPEQPQRPIAQHGELTLFESMAAALQPGQDFPPEFYRSLSQFLQRDAAIRFLVPEMRLAGDEAVLDLGCGEGKVTAEVILPKVPLGAVTGVDINPAAIEDARKSFSEDRLPIKFLVGDIESLSESLGSERGSYREANSTFDVICSNFTLHWPKDLEVAFGEMRRVISDAGRMVHLFSGSDPFPELFGAAHTVMQTEKWQGYFENGRFRHPPLREFSTVTAALGASGFELSSGGVRPVWHTFPNEVALAGWMGKMPRPIVARIPEEEQAQFGRDVVDEYQRVLGTIDDYPAVEGREIAVRHNMILFTARPA